MPSSQPEWIAMEMFLSSLPPLSPPLSVLPLLEPLSELPPLLDPLSSEPHAASVRAAAAPSAAIDRKRLFFLIISFHERFSTVRDCFEVCVLVAAVWSEIIRSAPYWHELPLNGSIDRR